VRCVTPEPQLSPKARRCFSPCFRLGTLQLPSSTSNKPLTTFSKEKGEEGNQFWKTRKKTQSCLYTLELKWEHGLIFLFAIQLKNCPISASSGTPCARRGPGGSCPGIRAVSGPGHRSSGSAASSADGKPSRCGLPGEPGSLWQGW